MTNFKNFRKKPVVIKAMKWRGDPKCLSEILRNFNPTPSQGMRQGDPYVCESDELIIPTLEGKMKANVGDYIIIGVAGEMYPCKPKIFDATYEEVKD